MAGFWDGSGISWTIFKQSAPRSRQITTPTPHQSMFTGRMLFLAPNQQCQSTEGNYSMVVQLQSEIKTYNLLEAMGARTPMPPTAGNASVRWQRGTARIQPPTPLLQQSVYISCHQTHSSKPSAAGLLLWTLDRRTDTVPFHRPCSTYYAGSAHKAGVARL